MASGSSSSRGRNATCASESSLIVVTRDLCLLKTKHLLASLGNLSSILGTCASVTIFKSASSYLAKSDKADQSSYSRDFLPLLIHSFVAKYE